MNADGWFDTYQDAFKWFMGVCNFPPELAPFPDPIPYFTNFDVDFAWQSPTYPWGNFLVAVVGRYDKIIEWGAEDDTCEETGPNEYLFVSIQAFDSPVPMRVLEFLGRFNQ